MFSRERFPPREIGESHSHFYMVRGLVPSMDRCNGNYHSGNGGTYSVTRNTQSRTERAIMTSRLDVRAEPFCHGSRIRFLPCQM